MSLPEGFYDFTSCKAPFIEMVITGIFVWSGYLLSNVRCRRLQKSLTTLIYKHNLHNNKQSSVKAFVKPYLGDKSSMIFGYFGRSRKSRVCQEFVKHFKATWRVVRAVRKMWNVIWKYVGRIDMKNNESGNSNSKNKLSAEDCGSSPN